MHSAVGIPVLKGGEDVNYGTPPKDEVRQAIMRSTTRDAEAALLTRCSVVAREVAQSAQDQREANVFRLAAMVIRSRFPAESQRLMQASERYFALHPNDMLAPADVVRKGWVLGLPRLHDMLSRRLCGH